MNERKKIGLILILLLVAVFMLLTERIVYGHDLPVSHNNTLNFDLEAFQTDLDYTLERINSRDIMWPEFVNIQKESCGKLLRLVKDLEILKKELEIEQKKHPKTSK